jgi:flagella basal body P-ring formation protein FlgA
MFVNRLTLLLCLAAVAHTARAQDPAALQALPAVRAAAESAVRGVIDADLTGVKLEAVALDTRLRLAACAGKLDAFAQAPRNAQSRVIARVSCAAPAWSLNVPVELRRTQDVLVLKRAVGRGESLNAGDVGVQKRELPGLASPYLSQPQQLAGRLTRRPIPEGTALTADALGTALLIHRGQLVTLVAHSAGFEVRAPGRAMADAPANQRVRVQNLNSLKIVEGLADTDGVVRVSP